MRNKDKVLIALKSKVKNKEKIEKDLILATKRFRQLGIEESKLKTELDGKIKEKREIQIMIDLCRSKIRRIKSKKESTKNKIKSKRNELKKEIREIEKNIKK